MSNEGGKVKQTRRRQRLSCVECTKRRQKCDRQIPCGLCISRGVGHLCRWEPIVARPAPQRRSIQASNALANVNTIEALSARIAVLEQTLLRQNLAIPNSEDDFQSASQQAASAVEKSGESNSSPLLASGSHAQPSDVSTATNSGSSSGTIRVGGPHALYDSKVQAAAVALAQLSLAPREEYVGAGTILCALHKMGDPEGWRFPFAHSTFFQQPVAIPQQSGAQNFSEPFRALVNNLPPRERVNELLDAFFAERNWGFGLPEGWVRQGCRIMWNYVDLRCPGPVCLFPASCTTCTHEVNAYWMSFLFSILALAPGSAPAESAAYFTHALTAKRLADDILLAIPTYWMSEKSVDGSVHGCIAAALLSAYLADRGRVSEAWKLVGFGLRNAQAMGLHRDPGWRKWEAMSKQESEMRLLGWWHLWIRDRLYSFILGRPAMASKNTFDVTLLPSALHGDGTPNPHAPYQQAFIRLCEVIGDGAERCLGVHPPSYSDVLDVDRRFKEWLSQLSPELQWRNRPPVAFGTLSIAERSLVYQREALAAYYLGGLMNIHRLYLMQPPPIPPSTAPHLKIDPNASREHCISLAIELVRMLCQPHIPTPAWLASPRVTLFHYSYFVFDGSVALVGARAQTPPHPRESECIELLKRAVKTLRGCVEVADARGTRDGEGGIARRAITVLEALRRASEGAMCAKKEKERSEQIGRVEGQEYDYDDRATRRMAESNARDAPHHDTSLDVTPSATTSVSPSMYMSNLPHFPYPDSVSPFALATSKHSRHPDTFPASTPSVSFALPPNPPHTSLVGPPLPPQCSSPFPSCIPDAPAPSSPPPSLYPRSDTSTSHLLPSVQLTPFDMLQGGCPFDAQWVRLAGVDTDMNADMDVYGDGWLGGDMSGPFSM